ncbi:MAG: pyridoxal-dependent decarboxylase [Bacilli bacterium]|nr:pyridoxal-dependent decarboxylase [Bacilli bacterium]
MKEILSKDTKDYSKICLEKVINMGIDFKLNNKFKEKNYDISNFSELLEIPNKGTELNELLDYFKNEIMPYCSNFSNEKFMSFPDSGNSTAAISGAILSDFLQQNLINSSFCAPIATHMEIAVIKWLRELLGYEIKEIKNIWDVGGVITYGGTGSNATAMLLARENHNSKTMIEGVKSPENYKVVIPKGIAHYSIRSSLMWIGCGNNILEVPTKDYRYNLDELKKTLIENKGKIMSVVCYVGDSRTQSIDNLTEIYKLVKEIDENIWLHADACHGFSLAFSKKLKCKIEGIQYFDSISTDPHKVLATPYCISALLIKDPENFKLVTSSSDLIMQEDYAFGQVTPFIGSKSWVSLKLWFMIKNIGIEKIGQMIEKRCEMAQYLSKKIINSNDFVLLNSVNINSVVFMYVQDKEKLDSINIKKINEKNIDIHKQLSEEGIYHLHQFSLTDDNGIIKQGEVLFPLRYMSGNPNITKKDIDDMLTYLRKLALK